MIPGKFAQTDPDRIAVIMAGSGESISFGDLEKRTNRLAHFFRLQGLNRCDHYAIFMENNINYVECCGAGARAGLYFTPTNSYLGADELAYILNNSRSRILITSRSKLDVARAAMAQAPGVALCLVVDGDGDASDGGRVISLAAAVANLPDTPIEDEWLGIAMLYSSGTTGRPKGIVRPLPEVKPDEALPLYDFLNQLWRYRDRMVYLSPAPLYHSAPQAAVGLAIMAGGTAVIMESFNPEAYLQLVERYRVTHSQLVPTMFSRMLKLPEDVRRRHDLSSLEVAIHAAAPCPIPVKEAMIDWWGPIIHEYYGATEGLGFTACDTAEWLAHKGTVGRVVLGEIHILDDDMQPMPPGEPGTIWFTTATPFEYFENADKTNESRSADGTKTTVGDVGYLDDDSFLHLTDRKTFMIISGGMNIYPQECENLLITHPKVTDAAVFGVPNDDLGEEVKAVVQAAPGVTADAELAAELIAFCRSNMAHIKCPRSIDFTDQLPRLPTGKLYKRELRDPYWVGRKSKIG
ncbi:AMP-binding protein [Sandarakinorhabdus rubra]|uniref:AMP-binding protein n=1 Tax=Sandarakinorhabdus rubra TaxID=2672568 RepID=UPI0013DADF6B|nr:AMP-binding protein [Sandarakinorhabdus rubra]